MLSSEQPACQWPLRRFRLQPEEDNFRRRRQLPPEGGSHEEDAFIEQRRMQARGARRRRQTCLRLSRSRARTGDDDTTHGDGDGAGDGGPDRRTAGAATAAAAAAAVDRRPHERHEEARRLLPALLGRAHRIDVPRDLRGSTPTSCSRTACRPASARTTSASIAVRAAAAASSRFQRVGPRVMLVQPNQSFRSSSKNPLERKSVEDSFAKSILWGFTVAAESNGRVLVDATDFFLRDMTNAANSLRPGNYRVDPTRSAFYLPNTRDFPKNTEVDVTLTFVNDAAPRRRWWRRRPDAGPDADWPVRSGAGRWRRRWWRWRRIRRRPVLGHRRQRDADARRGDAARARLVRRAARQQLPAARRRSARRLRRPDVRRLQRADRRADADALHPPPSPAEEGSRTRR